MAGNGNLPSSDLAPIYGGGYLRKDAAAAWNAMAADALKNLGISIRVKGDDSAYRTYARQVYWRNYWCARGACHNAAVPGTSNHGWGVAVDVDSIVGNVIRQIGPKYGWNYACSDAPWESWHVKWCGGWSGSNPGPAAPRDPYPTLKKGKKGKAVKRAQNHLRRWNFGIDRPTVDGDFGKVTKKAVKQFQYVHGLKPDGVVGKRTWKELRGKDKLMRTERWYVNRYRLSQRKGVTAGEKEKREGWRRWLQARLDEMERKGRQGNWWWKKHRRRARYKIIKRTVKNNWR